MDSNYTNINYHTQFNRCNWHFETNEEKTIIDALHFQCIALLRHWFSGSDRKCDFKLKYFQRHFKVKDKENGSINQSRWWNGTSISIIIHWSMIFLFFFLLHPTLLHLKYVKTTNRILAFHCVYRIQWFIRWWYKLVAASIYCPLL